MKFDKDNSGAIDYMEFKEVWSKLGVPAKDGEMLDTFALIDTDGSGSIEYPEFLAATRTFLVTDSNFWSW